MSSNRRTNSARLLEGPIGPVLRELTIPMIFGIVSLILFTLVDAFFVSLLGTEQLAALGFTFPVTTFVSYLGIGLGIGTSATVARVIGEGSHDRAARLVTDSLMLAAVLVVIVTLAGRASIETIFPALGATEALMHYVRAYMEIWFTGVVFMIISMVGSSAIRATGDTRTPGRLLMMAALANGIIDPLLIFGLGPFPALGVAGAALASLLAWGGSAFVGFWVLNRREQLVQATWPGVADLLESWRRHLRISAPAAAANMLTPVGTGIITAMVAAHGAQTVAAYGVATRVEALALLVVLALSTSLPPFISQNLGAGRMDRVEQALRLTLRFTLFWELAVYGMLLLAAPWIASVFTDDPFIARVLRLILYVLPASYGAQGMAILVNSSFNALHEPRNAMVLSIARWFACYVPFAFVGSQIAGLPGLFAGAALGNVVIATIGVTWILRYCAHRRAPVAAPATQAG